MEAAKVKELLQEIKESINHDISSIREVAGKNIVSFHDRMSENGLKTSATDTKSFDALMVGLFGYFDFTDYRECDVEKSCHKFLKVLLEVGEVDAISLSRKLRKEWNSIAKKHGASPSFLSKETLPEEEYHFLDSMEVQPIELEDRDKRYGHGAEAWPGCKPVEHETPSYHSQLSHDSWFTGKQLTDSYGVQPVAFSRSNSIQSPMYRSYSSDQQRNPHTKSVQHPSNQRPLRERRFQSRKSSENENITAQAFKSQYNEIVRILQEKEFTVQFANKLCAFKIIPPSVREQLSLLQDESLIQTKAIVREVRVIIERAVGPKQQMRRVIDVLCDPVFHDQFKYVIEQISKEAQLPEEGQGQLSKPPSAVTTKSKQDTMDKPQSTHDLSQEPYKVYTNKRNLPVDPYKRRLYLQYQNNLPSNDMITFDSNKYSWKYYNLVTSTPSASQTGESGGALNLHCIPLEENRYPPRTLIIGPPGVGKSSIVVELCKRWYSQQLLCEYEYVVLLKADDPPVDLLKDLIQDNAAIFSIEAAKGDNTLFIIDGYDEFSQKQREKNSFYDRIIQGKIISEAAVIVTARPWCAKQLSHYNFDTIEIRGLTHESRNEYISQSGLVSNSAKIRNCFPKSLEACTSNPLYLATLVKIFSSDNNYDGMISKPAVKNFISITKLYGLLVQTLIFDFTYENEKLCNALISFDPVAECDFSGLPRDIYIPFFKLCILSYKSLFIDKVNHLELTVEPDAQPTFNLLMKLEGTQLNGRARFIFRHSSIHEYLAAYCISRMKEEDKIRSLQNLLQYFRPQYVLVVEFLYGLGCITNTKLKDDRPLTRFDFLRQLCEAVNSFDLIKEVYQSKACEQSNVVIHRTWPLPYPYDLMCLGRVIALSNRNWELGFTYRPLHDEHLEMLCEGIKSVNDIQPLSQLGRIKQIKLSLTTITEKGISHLGEIPEQCLESIEEIQLRGIGLTSTAQLCTLLPRLSGLQKLFLHDNKFKHNERMELLKNLICYCNKLMHITFSDLDPKECATLLRQYPSLETVELWRISTDSCQAVIENLATDDTVQGSKLNTLEIYQSEITPTSISSLPITLPRSKIVHLKLCNCNINCETVGIVAKAACSSEKLQSLDLSDNDIKDEGGKKLLGLHISCKISCAYNHGLSESMCKQLVQYRAIQNWGIVTKPKN